MVCRYCGGKIPDYSMVCRKCGKAVDEKDWALAHNQWPDTWGDPRKWNEEKIRLERERQLKVEEEFISKIVEKTIEDLDVSKIAEKTIEEPEKTVEHKKEASKEDGSLKREIAKKRAELEREEKKKRRFKTIVGILLLCGVAFGTTFQEEISDFLKGISNRYENAQTKADDYETYEEEMMNSDEAYVEEIYDEGYNVFACSPDDFKQYSSKLAVTEVTASSSLKQTGHDNSPKMVLDGDETTSWQDGVEGDGIGQTLDFYFEQGSEINYMTFKLGNWRSYEYYVKNNTPAEIIIDFHNGENYSLTFPHEQTEFAMGFEPAMSISHITIEISDVYSGTQYQDTCIAEIGFYGI